MQIWMFMLGNKYTCGKVSIRLCQLCTHNMLYIFIKNSLNALCVSSCLALVNSLSLDSEVTLAVVLEKNQFLLILL